MKDWKQEIAEAIRERCEHGPHSGIVGPGCPECQALFVDIMWIMNSALDSLTKMVRDQIVGDPADVIAAFKRSIPAG